MPLALFLALALAPAPASGTGPAAAGVRGVGVEESLEAGPVLAPALDAARPATGVPMFVHLSVSPADVTGDTATQWPALD